MTNNDIHALLHDALDAHGGLTRWNTLEQVRASLISGGLLYDLKGQKTDRLPRQMTVDLTHIRTRLHPFGAPDRALDFTDSRVAIISSDDTIAAEAPTAQLRDSFAGHSLTTSWNSLQRAYFSGYALWTYLNSPFLLTRGDIELYHVDPIEDNGHQLDGIGATFPPHVPTHSRRQQFYFSPDRRLRRHDYHVDLAGNLPASQYLDDYIAVQGIAVPLTRRAYRSTNDGTVLRDQLMVAMRFNDVAFDTATPRPS